MTSLTTNEISIVFLVLFLLLLSSFLFGKLFEFIKAPKVVGEIVGGMVVGGSVFALLLPELFSNIFYSFEEEGKILNIFYQLGLVFLMFSSGVNTTIKITKENIKKYSLLFIGATVIPILLGIPFVKIFESSFIGEANSSIAFLLVFLISTAITSIPVISKIFFDIGMMNTKFSNMVLTVSTIQDLCLWVMLNLSINIVETGQFNLSVLFETVIITIGLLIAAKVLEWYLQRKKIKLSKNVLSISFLILFLFVYLLSKLNINIMYSAFISGYILKAILPENSKEVEQIKNIGFSLFVPIYFALVGLQLDVIHNFSFVRFIVFFIIVFGLEFIGTVLFMWFTKLKRKTVISLGITMNARGGPGIVLATTAYAYNIINIEFFTVLILTTMLSSALAGYWLRVVKEDIQDDA
jgi:Kef-type K+ transport system membrane component KefB